MEILKHIPGYHGFMASSNGDICSVKSKLSASKTGNGYLKVKIKRKTRTVHRLVAMAFHGIPEPNMVVNHINGVKTDNRPENLEWVTYSQNIFHSLNVLGNKPNHRKIIIDKNTGVFYDSIREVCLLYGIKETTLNMKLKGKNRNNTPFVYA